MDRRRRWNSRKRALTFGLIVIIVIVVCGTSLVGADQVSNFAQLETNVRLPNLNQTTRDLRASASSIANANLDDTDKDGNPDTADAKIDDKGDDASSKSTMKKTSESTNEPTTVDDGNSNTADSKTTAIMTPETTPLASSHASNSASDLSTTTQTPQPPNTPEAVTIPNSGSTTEAPTSPTNAPLPIDLTKQIPSIKTPTTSVSLESDSSTGSNKEPSTDTPAEAPTTSDDGSESSKAGTPPETPTKPDDGSESNKAGTPPETPTKPDDGSESSKAGTPPETPTKPDDGSESNKAGTPPETPTKPDDGSESNKAGTPPETPTKPDDGSESSKAGTPPETPTKPDDGSESNKAGTPPETPTKPDDGSESSKAGSPPETPTTPDADSATDASTKTKPPTNALLPIDLTKKLPSIETPTTSVSLDSEDSTGSNKEPSTDTPAEAPTTSDDGSESSKAGSPPVTPTKPDDGSESNKAGTPPETPTTPDADSATDASTKTKPPTNALLPIDLTKKLPSIETPTTSVSLDSEDSTGSNKEPSTDTPAEAPTTSDDGSESSKAGTPPETPTKPDDGSESNKAGSPPETPTTPDADSATDASTKTKPPTNALLPIDLTKKLPSIETPTTSVSLDSEDSTGSNKEPSTDTPAEAPTTSDDGSESSKAGTPPETPTKPDDGSESNKAGSPPETPTTPDADSATDASTKTKPATNALLPIDLTKKLPSIETPTTSVSLESEDSTGSNKEPSTDTPAEAPTTSDDGSESSKAGTPPETPTKPDDGSESNKAGSPPETPTTPDADSATDASTKTKPPTNALLPIDLTKKLPSIETPTTSVSLDSEDSTGSNKEPSTDTPAEAPTTSDDGSESSKAGTPPETPTKPDDGSESNKAGSPPETPTTPDADSATDASTKTKPPTNALLPIDLTKKLPSIETPTTSVSLDSEDSTGSNKEPSTDTPAEAPTTSDDGSESSKAGTPPETPTKPDDGSESNKAGSPPETPTTPDADSATDASTKTKPPTNALLPIDLTKKLPSIETPTTSVSLDSEDSTGSNKEPSTDTPAEAPTTSDDGSESSKAGTPPETPTTPDDGNSTGSNKEPSTDTPAEAPTTSDDGSESSKAGTPPETPTTPDDGSESSKAGSPPETPTTPDADSATDASTKTKPPTNALLPIDLTKKLPSIETPTTSVSLDSEDSTGSNKEPSTDTPAEAPTTSDDGSESSKAGSPPETPTKPDDGSESNKAGLPPETPTTPDADSATDASTKTKPPTNALLPIDLTKKLPSIETPTTSVSLDSEDSTGSNKEPSTDTPAEAPTTSDDGSESSKAGSPPETPTKPDDGSESNKAGLPPETPTKPDDGSESSKAGTPPETPTTPDADSATDASTKTKPPTNALLPIDLTKKLPSIETPTTSVSLDSEDSTGSNKEPSTDTPAEAPTTSDDGSESSKAGTPPETPTTPDADSATDAPTKTKPPTNALLPIDLTKKLPSIETPTTSVSLDSEDSTGSNKEPSTDTPAEAPTTSDDGSESSKAGSPPETPTKPDDGSESNKAGSPPETPTKPDDGSESSKAGTPPETPTTPDADSATDASTKTKPPTNALLPIDLTKKLPSIETPTTSVSLDSEDSTGSNKEPSTDTPAEAPTTSDDGSESSKAGSPPETPTKPDDGSESNKAGLPPETPTTPDADSATDASTKTKPPTNALLPIDLTKKLPSIETPTTSVSLDSEDSTGSNKEPSTDTPAEAPTTSDDGSESSKAGTPPETPTTPDADSATDAPTKTKPPTNALLPIDLTKKLPSIETPTTSVSLDSEDSTGSNKEPSTDTPAEAPTTSDDGSESSKAGSPPETPTKPDDGSESNKAGLPPETPTTPDADSATDASTKTKPPTNALLPIDLTKKLPSIETPTTSVSLDSEDSTGSNKEPSTDTPAEAPTTSDDGSESNAPTKTKPPTNALLPIDLTKKLPSIETPTTSVSLDSEDSTGSNKEPSTDTPAEAPTTSDDGSESSKAGSPPETPTKPDDGSESNKAGSPPETPTKPDDGSESSKAGTPPETPTTPDADSATDASTKTKPPTNALLPIDLTKKLPSIETPTTSVSLDSEDSTGSNKEPSTDTPAEAPTTSDDGSESSKAGSPPETPTKPDDGSESNKAGLPPETPTTPDADSATDASTKTKPPTNALLPIDLTKKLPSIETPTTSVSLDSEDSTGSNKEPSTDTPAEAPTTSDDGSESSKAGTPPETPTTPDADSATDAPTKTKPPTNALLPIDLTKKLPSIETPTTSVSLDSEDSTGSNKEPSTDTPAEAPTTSDDGSESSKAGTPPETPTKPDDGSESNKAGSPPETPTTPDADSATDASTKTKPPTNALLPIDLTKKLPSIETPTTSVSLDSEDSTGSNKEPSTDTPAEAPTTSDDGSESSKPGSPPETPTKPDDGSESSKAGSPPETPTKPDDGSESNKAGSPPETPTKPDDGSESSKAGTPPETPTTPDADSATDAEDSTGSNKEPSTDTPAEAPTTSDDGSESSKAGSPPETPTKPDDGSESNKAGSPPETPTTPDADSATDASTKTKPPTNALLPIDLTKKLPSIETPTTSVSLDSEDSTGSNKEPSTDTPAEAPTTSDDGSESSKAGTPPETPTTPDADSATDAPTKTKPATNALLPIDLTKKLPSIETPTTSVSLDSEDSTGSNKEPSTDTPAEAPTTSDDGSESSKAGTPPETPTTPDADSATDAPTKTKPATNALLPIDLTKKLPSIETPTTSVSLDSEDSTGSNKEPSTDTLEEAPTTSDDGSESNKAGSPPETPTTPDADSATDAPTKTKPATNALLPIDLTKKLPSIETPTTSVSLDSEDSTGSNKEPSTDTPAEAPTTSDDGSESNKAGTPPETPTTPDADSATDAPTKTKPATNALLPIDLTKKLPSIETPTTSVSLDSEDSTGSNKEPSTDTPAEAPTTSDDGSESSKAGTPPETPSSADAGSEASVTTESSFLLRTSGSSDETPAHTPTLPLTQWSPPPVLRAPARVPKSHSELSVSDSSPSQTGSSNPPHSLQSSKTPESSPDSPEDVMGIPAPVTSDPRTSTRPTPTTASLTPTPKKPSPSVSSSSTSGASSSDSPNSPEPSTDTAPAAASRKPTALDDNTPSPAPVKRAPALKVDSAKTHDDGNDVSQTEQTSLEMSPSELNKPSPAPVTRSPPSKAIMMPPSKAVSMPPSKAISMPPSKAISMPPSKAISMPPSKAISMPPSKAISMPPSKGISMPPSKAISMPPSKAISMPPSLGSSDSMGTVMPADISDITDSAAEKVEKVKEVEEAEAITKQIDSGGHNEADENMIKDNDMILLGDTGSMITYSDGNKVTTFEKYNRGVDDLQTIRDEDDSYNNIIVGGGNRSNLPPGASISLSSASQKMQNTLLYTSYTLGAVSTVLLMFFHLLALHRPPWLGGSGDQGGGNGRTSMGWLTPNVWELIVVVGYIQHISSISMLELTKAPQIVLDFTDSFSFANLHLSSVTTTAVSKGSRRLQLVILTGIVAFSDRIGVDENEVLLTMFWFLLVAIAILGVLFASAAGFTFYRQHLSASTWSAFSAALRSSFAMCVVGLGVAAWVLSVFPLVVMSSYELVMQLRYRVGIGLAVALFSLWAVVAGGLSYAFVSVRAIPLKDAFRFKHFAVWGSLYGDSKMVFRYFFVVTVSFQILLGVITGAVSGMPAQLVALMVTHLLFVVIALIIRPFADRWVLGVVVSLRVIAIGNLLCSFAFLTSSSLSLHWRGIVAQSFVVFNAITLILFFARYIAMFVLALKRWSSFTSRESVERYEMTQRLARSYNDRTPIFVTHDLRNHHQLHDGGRFIASGAGFTPTTRSPEYSSRYSSDYSDRHVYSSRQRYAPTPLGSSYTPDSRVHEQSHYH
ncbi:hypothetical protein KXD40_000691 [Peronospora effusa]|nr:hypothetical protein KXD40_000691 [Peronospora effusa]